MAADFGVSNRWHCHACRVNLALHRCQRMERLRAEFLCEGCSACRIRVEHPDKFGGRYFAVNTGMVASEFTASDHSDTCALHSTGGATHGAHHFSLPSEEAIGSASAMVGKA